MKTCPKCKLGSPDEALRCDCGYDFETKRLEKSFNSKSTSGIPVENLTKAKFEARIWLAASILIIFLYGNFSISGELSPSFYFPVAAVLIVCCSRYAVCKGYDWTLGLLGFFSIVGLAFIIAKPYKIRGT